MYKSPIDLIYDHLVTEQENEVFKAVVRCGIDVDKDELIKALAYDRRQYDLGYADGKMDAEPQWIPCSERLPEDDRTKVVTLANGNAEAGYYSNGDWWCVGDTISLENPTVIAWMPLPKPYEVEDEETD